MFCCWELGKTQKKGLAGPPGQKKGEESQERKSWGVIISLKMGFLMSLLFEDEGGRSNGDGNVSVGKGDIWSVAMGQVEHPQGMTTKPNTDHILVSANSSWLLF